MIAGLTCTADNCSEKGGFFNHAAKAGIVMVLPDTSPRMIPMSLKVLDGR